MEKEQALLQKILYLSNTNHCESAEDMQYSLMKIYDLIINSYPDMEEDND